VRDAVLAGEIPAGFAERLRRSATGAVALLEQGFGTYGT
jgi:hypothetical protein